MKNLDFDYVEMNCVEMKNINGGFTGILEGVIIAAIAIGMQGIYELGKAHGAEHK